MTSVRTWPAHKISEMVKNHKISALEVAQDIAAAIESTEKNVRAWEFYNPELFFNNAEMVDTAIQKDEPLGNLCGVPIGVKDVFNTKDMPTTMGSSLWTGFTPGNDARVVSNIRLQQGVVVGKTVTAEFAVHYLAADKTLNPRNPAHIPGTSSSGSAAAVAAGMIPVALGTQTAGSIIRPASYCGVFGMKPTFGTIPRTGVLKTTDTLDTIGFFSRDIDDLEILFDTMRVHGRDYPYVHTKLKKSNLKPSDNITIGILNNLDVAKNFEDYTNTHFANLCDKISKQKPHWKIKTYSAPREFNEIHQLHATIYDKSLSYYFKQESTQIDQLSTIMQKIVAEGNKISFEAYHSAVERQSELRKNAEEFLKQTDIILIPSTAGEAPLVGVNEKPDTCLIWTFLGLPVVNYPAFTGPKKLPFGLQIVAKRFDDYKILEFARNLNDLF